MKQYGAMVATEFSKKQIGVIYRMAKNGELKVEKWIMSELYDLADYYGYDHNRSVAHDEGFILNILEDVFSGNAEGAQKRIDQWTAIRFDNTSMRKQRELDRELVR